jgi:hypothetical protein
MICLLESYKSAFRDRRPNEQEHFFLCQQVAKAVIALGEALLIDRIQYHFSAKCRKQLISDLFPDEKQFVGLHEWSINFKLLPNQHRSVDAVHYWHAAVNQYVNQLPRFLYVDEPILFFLSQDQAMTSIYRYLSGCENADPKAALEKSELSLLAAEATEEPLKSLFTKMAVRHLEKAAVSVPPRVDWDDIRQLAVSTWHRRFH